MRNYLTKRHDPFDFMDPFFDDFFAGERNYNQLMKTDIKDEGDHYQLKMDLPAIKKEDIRISLNEGYLKISATFHDENEKNEQHGKYIHKERHYGSYSRSFYLGENVNEKDIHAKLENGVLTLNIEKREEKEKKENKFIPIE